MEPMMLLLPMEAFETATLSSKDCPSPSDCGLGANDCVSEAGVARADRGFG
jgi:hypothetical protein